MHSGLQTCDPDGSSTLCCDCFYGNLFLHLFREQQDGYEQEMHAAREGQDRAGIFEYQYVCCRVMSQAQHLTGHIPRLKGQVHGGWETSLGGPRGHGKIHAKEVENLKRIIGEITVANDILKKTLEGAKQ